MIKSELVKKIADNHPRLYVRDIELVVNTIFNEIIKSVADDGRVELRGFGTFSARTRKSRIGRNPRTGENVQIPDKKVPYFKTGKELRDRLNGK